MKKYWIALGIMILMGSSLSAQRARFKPQTFEIGVQLGMADFMPGLQDNYLNRMPTLGVANGLSFTYHLSLENAVRLKGMRYQQDWQDVMLEDLDQAFGQGQQTSWRLQLGYQRKYHTGPIQIFYGADFVFGQLSYENLSTPGAAGFDPAFLTLGIAPEAGIKWFFSPHLSASAEVQAQARLLDTRSDGPIETIIKPAYIDRPANILNLNANVSLNFHFVQLKKRCTCPRFR